MLVLFEFVLSGEEIDDVGALVAAVDAERAHRARGGVERDGQFGDEAALGIAVDAGQRADVVHELLPERRRGQILTRLFHRVRGDLSVDGVEVRQSFVVRYGVDGGAGRRNRRQTPRRKAQLRRLPRRPVLLDELDDVCDVEFDDTRGLLVAVNRKLAAQEHKVAVRRLHVGRKRQRPPAAAPHLGAQRAAADLVHDRSAEPGLERILRAKRRDGIRRLVARINLQIQIAAVVDGDGRRREELERRRLVRRPREDVDD
mmetsp:Transcript_3795/g.11593  ORF Transcript_3795/g.11593 Transcript_3795/m.11593 type:complete len:258 (+) Transcript_3795:1108-1881(+)